MGRAKWIYYVYNNNNNNNGRNGKWCWYKRTTLLLCTINICVAFYLLYTLFNIYYAYPSQIAVRYTPDQMRKLKESIKIRKASQPLELIHLVKEMKEKYLEEQSRVDVDFSLHLKWKIGDEILQKLRRLNASANATEQLEVVESWRKEKLKEANRVILVRTLNSTILPKEAGMLARALKHNWAMLSEEIGLWIPLEVVNKEHGDKPQDEEDLDNDVLIGKKPPPECNMELHTDYDGIAVRWGLKHHKQSAYDCCQACFRQAEHAQPGESKCNIWVFCPSVNGCYSPDVYEHKIGECWLKYAEKPRLNFKNRYSESYRRSHSKVPLIVPWVSGVVST
ncbi:hypothetical protein LguiB_019990 [Lonicera macranthoides]